MRITSTFALLFSALCSAADTEHSVAFSVGLSSTQRMYNKDTVRFDRVFVNEHNAYDPMTGIFTCPVAGLYLFHFHAYSSNKDTIMWLDLLHNDTPVVSVSGYNSHTVSSQTVMLKLGKGDRVQVESKDSQEFALFGLPDQVYSTFTGYLLHSSNPIYSDSSSSIVGR